MGNGYCLLGRQPILNRKEELVAYELLFRSPDSQTADFTDASYATASVIVNTLTGFGVEDVLGKHKGFINLDLDLLMGDSLNILPKERMVIELLETLKVTPALVERCRYLKESGFTLALDDHEYSPHYHELYEIIDIVKVDLRQSPAEGLSEMVRRFEAYPLQLLAEKVETQEEFKRCLDLGFDLFQGYRFAKPAIIKKRMDDSGFALLKLIRQLDDDELSEIEKTFRGEPALTYKLLLLVNSVGVGVRSKIDSIRHAITILGRQQIKRWVQLALFASGDERDTEDPLVEMTAVRAYFMENMTGCRRSPAGCPDLAEKAFMTGILSNLDKIYDISIAEVVRKLDLCDDVTKAITVQKGWLGNLLQVAELLESMDFQQLVARLGEVGATLDDVLSSQSRAFAWRKQMACQ
jgi:EAL and modified HD-GYP domain-containing signal transduction protein